MKIHLHVHIAPDAETALWMTKVLGLLNALTEGQHTMSEAQDRFARELGETKDAVAAVATKLGEQAAEIKRLADIVAAGGDGATADQLNAASDAMDEMQATLTAASAPPAETTT